MEDQLREYARLLIRTGVNVKPGQRLNISAQTDVAAFVRLCAEEAYDAGAAHVLVSWEDDGIDRLCYLRAADEIFDEPDIRSERFWQGFTDRGDADLRIVSSDPLTFQGVDPERVARRSKAVRPAKKAVMERMHAGRMQWCVASYPTVPWAGRVFPGMDEEQALRRLWEAVFKACRVTGDGTAPEKWAEQQRVFQRRIDYLNCAAFRQLRYHSSLGTDLTVGLPEGHYWEGGFSMCEGRPILPNIPTEEIYTAPHRLEAEGTITASMPLYLSGTVVDGIRMTLRAGKIVDASAAIGEEVLLKALDTDENARHLGECALVGRDSSVHSAGVLFQETLFDENAACHFAFGNAYPLVRGAGDLGETERLALGLNVSDTHVDFMVGTDDLSVTGVDARGREIPVMRDGAFVIDEDGHLSGLDG